MISFPYSSLKTLEGTTLKYDRAINSKIKRLYNKLRYTQGVAVDIGGGFQVVADTGMNVKVNCNGSWAHVGGDFGYEEAETRTLTAQAPDTTYDRIDMVVLRNDISQEVRAMDLYIVKGTPASSPKVPELTNTPEIQEICLATLFISRGVNTISQDRISDTRLNPEVCGVLTNAFGEIDASQFFAQLEQLAKNLQEEIKSINAGSEVMLKATYDPSGKGDYLTSDKRIFDLVYPVGSIYMSLNKTNPGNLFGGTWEAIEGRFLLGANATTQIGGYPAGSTGGEASHVLKQAELPNYNLPVSGGENVLYSKDGVDPAAYAQTSGSGWGLPNWGAANVQVSSGGSGQAHNNMPPYLAVHMWQRMS